jgi:hypothetical protein
LVLLSKEKTLVTTGSDWKMKWGFGQRECDGVFAPWQLAGIQSEASKQGPSFVSYCLAPEG